jgi:TolB-like protein/tetratricopeptide (TPR) repeat protein
MGSESHVPVCNNILKPPSTISLRKRIVVATATLLIILTGLIYYKNYYSISEASQTSIAVIPFLNNTGNANIEWYGLGIANEIRTQLSLAKQFDFISSMQATIAFKNSSESPKVIGEKLGVTHILSGAYQQIDNEVKVIVELVDSSTGKIVWSLPYSTTLSDVGNLQASIAKEVIKKFRGNIGGVHSVKINMKAFSEVTVGNEIYLKSIDNSNLLAAEHFRNAIKIDSMFFPAWASLIKTLARHNFLVRSDSLIEKELQSALQYMNTHFEDSWEKLEVQATYKYYGEEKYEEAVELFLKVLDENPDAELSNNLVSNIYRRQLKLSSALKYLKKAIKLRNTPAYIAELGLIYKAGGDYDRANEANRNAMANGFDVSDRIYRIHYLSNSLNSLPLQLKRKFGNLYYLDSIYLKRDLRGMFDFLRRVTPDSLLNQDDITTNKLVAYYCLKQDDSLLFYVQKLNTKNLNHLAIKEAVLNGEPGIDALLKTFPLEIGEFVPIKILLVVLARDYKRATQLLKELNKAYPEFGDYLFLNEPFYDRIKEEYPPFNEAIKNLKLPPNISDIATEKM